MRLPEIIKPQASATNILKSNQATKGQLSCPKYLESIAQISNTDKTDIVNETKVISFEGIQSDLVNPKRISVFRQESSLCPIAAMMGGHFTSIHSDFKRQVTWDSGPLPHKNHFLPSTCPSLSHLISFVENKQVTIVSET